MNLGVQYYRPPFPQQKYWEEDFVQIKDAGLNCVQLWVIWAWVESKPGLLRFDDYDRLIELAGNYELGVVLSTIAEIQPYWIHREIPGSEMIDHMGRKVISSNREECHFGLTPGGCTDHPDVWTKMEYFLQEVVTRYRTVPYLRGWDAWNELRWNVQADGLVCYCDHTLAAFRRWLNEKYGGLDALNTSWNRRYGSFEEILPGKLPNRPYTEMMAFENFLTWRANSHARARYDLIKARDPERPVTVHGAHPTPLTPATTEDQALNRGNDWFFADDVDGIGCSSFPKWFGIDDADFGMRIECVKSAAREKAVWLSELQGGRSSIGFDIFQPVDALSQQRWIWNGIACGADTILFWCWRDEVFGHETAGFGIVGNDGFAEERLSAMRITGRLTEEHSDLIDNYQPVKPEVGIMFSPQSYYLYWAQEGNIDRPMQSLQGYARSLIRKSIPYVIVEEEHLDVLSGLKILFLPRTIVMDEATEKTLVSFVEKGGTLVCESECGAYSPQGLYRYPTDRFTARSSGIHEIGRRGLKDDSIQAKINGRTLKLVVTQWLTPWQCENETVFADDEAGALIVEVSAGKGKLILCGSYLGDAYSKQWTPDFEDFVELMVRRAGWKPKIEILSPRPEEGSFVYIKSGESAGQQLVFIFFPPDQNWVRLRFRKDYFNADQIKDLISGMGISLINIDTGQECVIRSPEWRFSVLGNTTISS